MESKKSNYNQNHHAIFLPLPLQGHINPSINLSLKLASSKNFTITFLTFDYLHCKITQAQPLDDSNDIFSRVREGPSRLDIRYRSISDGLPLDFDRNGTKLEEALGWYVDGKLIDFVMKGVEDIILNSNPKVDVLIIDSFYPWGSKIATKFGLRFVSFWTETALVFNLYYHINLLKEHGHFDCPDTRKDPIGYIPGVKSLDPRDLTSYLQETNTSTSIHKILSQAFQDVKSAEFVLCNTIQELELDTILALQALIPFYAIGPTFRVCSPKNDVSTNLLVESDCSEWLNAKPNASVLYVSFGSLANLSKDDVMEIAYGLTESNVYFIWVLRPNIVLNDNGMLLPDGFKEGISDRGIVVPWTNQIAVLSHPAIGGFLTHCGWNSILESIWYGIPMLCFPVFTDQFTNRKLVVDDWNVGINLCEDKQLRRKDISARIKGFMNQEKVDEMKKNVKVVRNLLENALEDEGSSTKNLDIFVEQLNMVP
ncbi:unnamed protein product [Amaranthus hypochondriacus]